MTATDLKELEALEKNTAKVDELARARVGLIRAALDAGFSAVQVARATGLTRQRVWQIANDK